MYCVIVGDIIQSKSLDLQTTIESRTKINRILEIINNKYAGSILANFGLVRGDAFEGVLFSQQYAPKIMLDIIKSVYMEQQIRVRLSAVMDDLSIVSSNRNDADGKAFHIAVQKIDELRQNKSDHWFQVSMVTNTIAQPLVDGLLSLITALTKEWTEKQANVVWAMMECSNQQNLVSKKLDVAPSVVNKQLKAAQYEAFHEAWSNLEQFFIDYEEESITPQKNQPSYTTYYSIARRKNKLRDYSTAIKYFCQSLALAIDRFGENNPNLVPIYNGLSEAYLEQLACNNIPDAQKYTLQIEAKKTITLSLACQESLPKARLEFAQTLNLFGNYYLEMEDYEAALKYYFDAMQVVENSCGPNHPLVFTCNNNIAIAYKNKKDYETALMYYRKDLEYAEQNLENDPMSFADSLHNVGLCYYDMGKTEDALPLFEKELDILTSSLPAKHEYIIDTQHIIGKLKGQTE